MNISTNRTQNWLNRETWAYLLAALILTVLTDCTSQATLRKDASNDLMVSTNGHYLIHQDGSPFYWFGDTGWGICQRLTREEIDQYLDNRKVNGFTVIQAVAYWFPHGALETSGPLNEVNAYGHRPFVGDADAPQTSDPLVKAGGGPLHPNDYWDHVDYVIQAAKERGLTLVLLPCWGNAFINNRMKGSQIVFTKEEAEAYGQFLGKRYQDQSHIIWCLGGDVDPVNFGDKDQRDVYRAMAEGIGRGRAGNPTLRWDRPHPDWEKSLITFHAVRTPALSGPGAEGGSSSVWFHEEPWLDVNMMETFAWRHKIYPYVSEDYQKTPTKPTIMGEGAYEFGKYRHECGYITPLMVRQQGYHAFFAGATGYTYGHWSVWPFRGEYCGTSWQEALDAPGAEDVAQVMRSFLSEQEIFSFSPDQSLILSDNPGGELLQCAMINKDQSKILVYFPEQQTIQLAPGQLQGEGSWQASWFDPRNGNTVEETFNPAHSYSPPADWEDAILILEKP